MSGERKAAWHQCAVWLDGIVVQCVSFNICYTNLNGKFMYRTFFAALNHRVCLSIVLCACGLMLIFSLLILFICQSAFQMPKCIWYLGVVSCRAVFKTFEKASVAIIIPTSVNFWTSIRCLEINKCSGILQVTHFGGWQHTKSCKCVLLCPIGACVNF